MEAAARVWPTILQIEITDKGKRKLVNPFVLFLKTQTESSHLINIKYTFLIAVSLMLNLMCPSLYTFHILWLRKRPTDLKISCAGVKQ